MGKERGNPFCSVLFCSDHPWPPAGSRKRGGPREGDCEQRRRHRGRRPVCQGRVRAASAPEVGPGQHFLSGLQVLARSFLETIVIFQTGPSRPSWNLLTVSGSLIHTMRALLVLTVLLFGLGVFFFVVNQKSLALKFNHPKSFFQSPLEISTPVDTADVFELEIKKSILEEAVSQDAWEEKKVPFTPQVNLVPRCSRGGHRRGQRACGFAVHGLQSLTLSSALSERTGHTQGWD